MKISMINDQRLFRTDWNAVFMFKYEDQMCTIKNNKTHSENDLR